MKSLLITEVFPPKTGGSGRWFWEIYRRLPREEVVVAAGEDPRHEEFDRTHDLNVVRMPLTFSTWGIASVRGLRNYWQSAKKLARLARAERVDAVHCGKCLPEGLLAWWLRRRHGIPYLVYVHGEELNLASLSRELNWLTRRVLHGAMFVIANSRNTERLLKEQWGLASDRVQLFYPGVDTDRFRPARRDADVRASLGWHGRPVVLTVGRLQKRKGHDQMILALRPIREAIPTVLYAIVGDGEERTNLDQLVAREKMADHVQFRGELDDADLIRCYQQCDLFVLPNRQVGGDIEGFGMVLLEAQACGRAVAAGASGGTAETMSIPQTGLVVSCDGPAEVASLVIDLLSDHTRRDGMGNAAREWVVSRFDWTVLSQRAACLFNTANSGAEHAAWAPA